MTISLDNFLFNLDHVSNVHSSFLWFQACETDSGCLYVTDASLQRDPSRDVTYRRVVLQAGCVLQGSVLEQLQAPHPSLLISDLLLGNGKYIMTIKYVK